jgi:hypothetical protein
MTEFNKTALLIESFLKGLDNHAKQEHAASKAPAYWNGYRDAITAMQDAISTIRHQVAGGA